jgi:hypothetical protein
MWATNRIRRRFLNNIVHMWSCEQWPSLTSLSEAKSLKLHSADECNLPLGTTTAWGLAVHNPFIYKNQPGSSADFLPVKPYRQWKEAMEN